jgi:hypothetical protein
LAPQKQHQTHYNSSSRKALLCGLVCGMGWL